jgi:hypothetical protein
VDIYNHIFLQHELYYATNLRIGFELGKVKCGAMNCPNQLFKSKWV